MDTNIQPKPQNASKPDAEIDAALQKAIRAGHEITDLSVRGVFIFTASLLTAVVMCLGALVVMFKGGQYVDRRLDANRGAKEPGATSLVHARPDYEGPLLQVAPEEDLRSMRGQNAVELDKYGWLDKQAGIVRLPVDRAMDLLVQRGLPPVSPGLTIEALQRQRAQPQVYGQPLRP